jgi:hypothetical protein
MCWTETFNKRGLRLVKAYWHEIHKEDARLWWWRTGRAWA